MAGYIGVLLARCGVGSREVFEYRFGVLYRGYCGEFGFGGVGGLGDFE